MKVLNVNEELYEFGPFRVDLSERVLTKGHQVIPLTPKAFETLVVLVRNNGRIVEKEQLLQEVWPDTFVEEGVLAVNVAAIRKALADGEEGQSYIETVPRRGYRFVSEVRTIAPHSEDNHLSQRPAKRKRWILPVTLSVGLIVLLGVGLGWYIFRPRPTSIPPPSSPVPLTSYPGAERNPTFSPDGRQVAFSWNGPQRDNFDIYVKLADGGDPLRLTNDPAQDELPA